MDTSRRLEDLEAIKAKIFAECEKLDYLIAGIKEKVKCAVLHLSELNTVEFLRRYTQTYEYLNKYHVKILEQTCLLELSLLDVNNTCSDFEKSFFEKTAKDDEISGFNGYKRQNSLPYCYSVNQTSFDRCESRCSSFSHFANQHFTDKTDDEFIFVPDINKTCSDITENCDNIAVVHKENHDLVAENVVNEPNISVCEKNLDLNLLREENVPSDKNKNVPGFSHAVENIYAINVSNNDINSEFHQKNLKKFGKNFEGSFPSGNLSSAEDIPETSKSCLSVTENCEEKNSEGGKNSADFCVGKYPVQNFNDSENRKTQVKNSESNFPADKNLGTSETDDALCTKYKNPSAQEVNFEQRCSETQENSSSNISEITHFPETLKNPLNVSLENVDLTENFTEICENSTDFIRKSPSIVENTFQSCKNTGKFPEGVSDIAESMTEVSKNFCGEFFPKNSNIVENTSEFSKSSSENFVLENPNCVENTSKSSKSSNFCSGDSKFVEISSTFKNSLENLKPDDLYLAENIPETSNSFSPIFPSGEASIGQNSTADYRNTPENLEATENSEFNQSSINFPAKHLIAAENTSEFLKNSDNLPLVDSSLPVSNTAEINSETSSCSSAGFPICSSAKNSTAVENISETFRSSCDSVSSENSNHRTPDNSEFSSCSSAGFPVRSSAKNSIVAETYLEAVKKSSDNFPSENLNLRTLNTVENNSESSSCSSAVFPQRNSVRNPTMAKNQLKSFKNSGSHSLENSNLPEYSKNSSASVHSGNFPENSGEFSPYSKFESEASKTGEDSDNYSMEVNMWKPEEKLSETSSNKDGVLDMRNLIKKIDERIRERSDGQNVLIPDLRPVVARKPNSEEKLESDQSKSSDSTGNRRTTKRNASKKNNSQRQRDFAPKEITNKIEIQNSIPPKEGELCCISFIESPSEFYVQIIKEDNTLVDTLSYQIAEIAYSLKIFRTKMEALRQIDRYCFCFVEKHNNWFRAEVINWFLDKNETIEVRLIDYGNKYLIPLKYVREAVSYLYSLPPMAEKCELAWVNPPDNETEWPKDSVEYFKDVLNSEVNTLYSVSYVEKFGDRLVIDLQNNTVTSVAGVMIAAGAAQDSTALNDQEWCNILMKKQVIKAQGLDEEENITEEERLENCLKLDDDEEITDPNLAVSHYRPKDESRICRILLSRGYCFKGKNCIFSHEPLNPDGWTTDRESVYYSAFNTIRLPESGSEITVKIINILNLRTFYVVVKNVLDPLLIGQPVNNIRGLVKLMNNPEETRTFKSLTVIPGYGELILVKHENEMWQRGRVVDISEFANRVELEVFMVDFGTTSRVNMKNTRYIQEKHLYVPFQAVMCTLCNVTGKEDITEERTEMGLNYLEYNLLRKKLRAKVLYTNNSDCLSVRLFDESGRDVGEELRKAGVVNSSENFVPEAGSVLLVD